MAGELSFLPVLAVVMIVAAATTILFNRLRQPVALGLLAAGLLIGPHTLNLPFLEGAGPTIATLADLGILFIMFTLGLEFHLGKLKKVGLVAFGAATLELLFMLFVGFTVGRAFGWATLDSLFLGAILAISSSSIIVNILTEMGKLDEESSHVLFAILIAEDVAAVVIITLLSGGVGSFGGAAFTDVTVALLKIAIFVAAAIVLGLVTVPWLVDRVRDLRSDMVLTITVLGLLFGLGLLAAALGLSLALGGFMAGALIAESRSHQEVGDRIAPLRDMFTAVFFVAVGLQIDPHLVAAYWFPILVITLVSILGKIVAGTFATFVAGYPPATALRVGIGLAMIGEFSFIIASLAGGLVEAPLFPIAVTVSAFTTFVTPALIRGSDGIVRGLDRVVPAPLRTYASLYGPWMQRLRADHRRRSSLLPGVPRGTGTRFLVYCLVLAALLLSANLLDRVAVSTFGNTILVPGDLRVALWVAIGLLVVPVGILAFHHLRLIIDGLTEAAIPERFGEEEVGGVAAALRATFWLAAFLGASLLLLAASGPFLPSGPLLAAALLVLAVSTFVFWGAVRRMHENVEGAVEGVLGAAPAKGRPSRGEVMQLLKQQYPWDAQLDSVVVPRGSVAADRRIRDLDLRRLTGASIVSITPKGGKARPVSPDPDMVLRSGDTLVLLGEREQLEAARKLILAPPPREPSSKKEAKGDGKALLLSESLLGEASALAGASLAEAGLREKAGVTVLGLKRGETTLTNPDPSVTLQAGDTLVLWGTSEDLAKARALIEGPAGPQKLPGP
ncbi:MAG TPA: cation:proton antiporter [Candidatus Thermoplasmatota archaeon]|nr:cation:proton antiporter [Candidatus Thermoplasmatota archaeon]